MDTFRQGSKYLLPIINCLDDDTFKSLICALKAEDIPVFQDQAEAITKSLCILKLATYFEHVTENTGLTFEQQFQIYMKTLDSIVRKRIIGLDLKNPKNTEKKTRASQYYNKAIDLLDKQVGKELDFDSISSYSRIMFCLYMAIIENHYGSISTFNFSSSCLIPEEIIRSMKNERGDKGKPLFDMSNMYGMDRCATIISLIFLYRIINERVQGEYFNG